MRRLYGYLCDTCRETFTEWRTMDERYTALCPCGGVGKQLILTPNVHLESVSGHFPSATLKWEADHAKRMAREKRRVDNHGEQ